MRAEVIHGDARSIDYGVGLDGLITSPPYPGRIDYHEQHRYAFELLGLDERRAEEIGAPWRGTSRAAIDAYVDDMTAVFANARSYLAPAATVVLVVDDSRDLFGRILAARACASATSACATSTAAPAAGRASSSSRSSSPRRSISLEAFA